MYKLLKAQEDSIIMNKKCGSKRRENFNLLVVLAAESFSYRKMEKICAQIISAIANCQVKFLNHLDWIDFSTNAAIVFE